jgi:hydrogenase-1 operon protein HyaF
VALKDIPVRVMGPGSQPPEGDGATISYIDMPDDMHTYRPPEIPEPGEVRHLHGARTAMQWLGGALAAAGPGDVPQLANLTALDEHDRELVNQILGEGEVSVTYTGSVRARTQESVLAGVWRTLYLDADDRVTADILEVAAAPHVIQLPFEFARRVNTSRDDVPADVVNALPILVELESHCADYARTKVRHEVNLTLLPLTDADLAFLDSRLGRGPVDTLSRAYGKCQVTATAVPNVWWVRFYNSMGTPILTTLEVVDVPALLCAAPEDLADSATRLQAILTPYWADVA